MMDSSRRRKPSGADATRRHLPAFAALIATGALVAGCTLPIDRSLGIVTGDFRWSYMSATAGISFKEQYRVHDAFVINAAYMNPRDWDAFVLQADLISFGRIPEASQTAVYAGLGLGLGMWTADSPSGNSVDSWLRVPIGLARRFSTDNGEVFLEMAPNIGLGTFLDHSFFGFTGGVRYRL